MILGQAIKYIHHEKKIMYRDINLENVFLSKGNVILGDYGQSKVHDHTVVAGVINLMYLVYTVLRYFWWILILAF